jgi:hypothetical protein
VEQEESQLRLLFYQSTISGSDSSNTLYNKEDKPASTQILIDSTFIFPGGALSIKKIMKKNATEKTMKKKLKRNQNGY